MNDIVSSSLERAEESAAFLLQRLAGKIEPRVALICGSGLSGLADALHSSPRIEVDYAEIPHFPSSTVQGHVGKLVFGLLGKDNCPMIVMVGRSHLYEGYSMRRITFPVRVMKLLGIQTLLTTNAAGGLNPKFANGDIVVLSDHLNIAGLVGIHPLCGPNDDDFGVRFPALSDAYDLNLRRLTHRAWKTLTVEMNGRESTRALHEGVYAYVSGPSYETRAECRMLHNLGADVVGMSTVPEIIVARHCGLRVLALSLVTNMAVLDAGPHGDSEDIKNKDEKDLKQMIQEGKANHEEVIAVGNQAARDIQALVTSIVEGMAGLECLEGGSPIVIA